MSEATKMPYEPIPMPEMPALPEMPGLPDMPKPSFSRSAFPSSNAPPIPRKPLSIVDDRPVPHPTWGLTAEEFLPSPVPLVPATPVPVPAPAPLPTPTQAPTVVAPMPAQSGFPMSWLKPSRGKGVVLAGLASLGIGAFGLNALFPMHGPEAPKADTFADNTAKTPGKTPAVLPKITEERPPVTSAPGLTPKIDVVKHEESWNAVKPVNHTEPPAALPVPVTVPSVPVIPQETVPMVPTLKVPTEALPVPVLNLPETTPPKPETLAPPALPNVESKPLVLPVPGEVKVQPIKVDPVPELPKPELTVPKLEPTAPKPLNLTPTEEVKPLLVVPAPTPEVKPTPALPLPTPEVKPTPELKAAPPVVPLVPVPESPKLESLPTKPLVPEAPAALEAKTDYDEDIHKLRAGDTYAAISEKFYGTKTYANALRSYNDNADLARLRDVHVPPMYVIKKFGTSAAPTDTPRVIPAGVLQEPGLVTPPPIERDIQWGTAGSRKPTTGGDLPKPGEPVWR